MRIDRIELFHVAMPLIYPWKTAYGEDTAIHSVLCRLTSGSVDAWGESAPFAAPCYSPEWAGGIFALNRDWLAPAVVGREMGSGDQLQQQLALFKGNLFAKAVLDTAWWALQAKLTNQPLHQLLGATREIVPVGADFGVMDSTDDLLSAIGQAVDDGFPRTKLKFRPGWDNEMLAAVRRQFPNHTFHIDCNSGYRLTDVDVFRKVDEFNLAMIEQPLQNDDLIDHAELSRMIETPVCLDESLTTPRRAQQAADLQSCGYFNIKPGRVGGLTNAKQIHEIGRVAGIPCWVGGMLESSCGAGFCTALAMLDNNTYPADIFPSSKFYVEDLSDPPIELTRDQFGVPAVQAPHQLPEPVLSRLEKRLVEKATIGA
ncbi:MAG: o-succinylbenzoate synthase [Planctomycetaceae bacterium]